MTKDEFNKQLADLDRQLKEVGQAPQAGQSTVASVGQPWWTTQNAMTMSSVVLVFGVVVLGLCAGLMKGTKATSDQILRVFGTVLIITGALFLVVAGYNDQQMAPVMGLLGTLAGYLLGKSTEKKGEEG